VGGDEPVYGLGTLCVLVLDVLSLVENYAEELASWVEQGALFGKVHILLGLVPGRLLSLLDMLVKAFPLSRERPICGEHNIVCLQLGVRLLLLVEKEDFELVSPFQLLLDLQFPLLDKRDGPDDQVGLQSVREAHDGWPRPDREGAIP
jgi:hypothetical protein